MNIPTRLQNLPRDKRGFPIPFNVQRDVEGKPMFVVNDSVRQERCIRGKLCSICGERLVKELWFVGGPGSALHPDGAYIDPAMHHECATFALQTCPYLATPKYSTLMSTTAIAGMLHRSPDAAILVDETVDEKKPAVFVMVLAYGQSLLPNGPLCPHVRPLRPYHAVEFWKDGQQLALEAGLAALPVNGNYDLSCLRLIRRPA